MQTEYITNRYIGFTMPRKNFYPGYRLQQSGEIAYTVEGEYQFTEVGEMEPLTIEDMAYLGARWGCGNDPAKAPVLLEWFVRQGFKKRVFVVRDGRTSKRVTFYTEDDNSYIRGLGDSVLGIPFWSICRCQHCGRFFPNSYEKHTWDGIEKTDDTLYCSEKCYQEARRDQRRAYQRPYNQARALLLAAARQGKVCLACGQPLAAKSSRKVYCSGTCRQRAHRRERSGG